MTSRPAGGSRRRGACGEGHQRRERSQDWGGATRGRRGSRRWSGDGGRAAARGRALRRQQKRNRAEHVLGEEKERGGGLEDLFEKLRNLRGLLVN
jgi:hypothetical protein